MADIKRYLQWIGNCLSEDKIYFMDMTFNGMFCLDSNDLSVHFVHRFSCANADSKELSFVSKFYDNAIYFFPENAKVIMKYDLLEHQEQIIEIEDCNSDCFVTVSAIQRQQLIYLFPFDLSLGIYVLNLQDQTVTKDLALSRLFQSGSYCANAFLNSNGNILIGLYESNQLIEVDLETKQIVLSKCLKECVKIYTVCFDGNNCWILLTNSTNIYEWNLLSDEIKIYTNRNPVWATEREGMPYSNLVFLKNEVLVLNATLKNIFRINKETRIIENPIVFPKEFRRIDYDNKVCPFCSDYTVLEDRVLIHPCWGNMLLIYNERTKQIEGREIVVHGKDIPYLGEIFYKNFQESGSYVEDSDFATLECLMFMAETERSEGQSLNNKKIGQSIHQYVMQ